VGGLGKGYWLAQGVVAWVVAPTLAAWIMVPDIVAVFENSPVENIVWSYIYGALWGVGALTFGLTMRFLGLSLGYAMSLGFTTTFGTLIPPIYYGDFPELITTLSGWVILSGIGVCLGGIALCGRGGRNFNAYVGPL